MEVFCALIGVLFAYTHHPYALIAMALILFIRPNRSYPIFFLLALAYAYGHQSYLHRTIKSKVLSKVMIEGVVVSIPNKKTDKIQFEFRVDTLDGKAENMRVLLAWYKLYPEIHSGERWQFEVKLKEAHNLSNPGSFDYARWLASRHIAMHGYVRKGQRLPNQDNSWSLAWLKLREKMGDNLAKHAPNASTSGIVQALTLGLTNHIDQEQWALFRRTGTTHLMVISGAHIGLVAGMIFKSFHWLWRCSAALCLRIPALRVASIAAMLSALAYALLSGFAVPAQRSFLGAALAALRFCGSYRFSGWQIWRYALSFALVFEPHVVLLPGFYLSFIAVAILMLVNQRWRLKGYLNSLLMQLACLIGLIPLTLFWFGYGSITGFIANLFAIPLVGLLIVPISMFTLAILDFHYSDMVMQVLNALIWLLLTLLNWVDQLSLVNLNFSLTPIHRPLVLMLGLAILVMLSGKTFRLAAFFLILTAFFPYYPKINRHEAIVRVLDVGQGLAVLVQTQNHSLLYDTGDAFYHGTDMGKLVILPLLQTLGIKKLDAIVISHPDKDHYGGLHSIEQSMPVDQLIVNEPAYYKRGFSCHNYPAWQWDGIDFRFFPIEKPFKEKNNLSCVLHVAVGTKRMLLTGDIEKTAEHYLVERYGKQLESTVLLVAHHGSKTSSSEVFLKKVAPEYAIASLGFDNRFHFPHIHTLERYKKLGIPLYSTRDEGMIRVDLNNSAP